MSGSHHRSTSALWIAPTVSNCAAVVLVASGGDIARTPRVSRRIPTTSWLRRKREAKGEQVFDCPPYVLGGNIDAHEDLVFDQVVGTICKSMNL